MPTQPTAKTAQGFGQIAVAGVGDGVFSGLVHRAHGDGAKGQVRAQAAAGVGRRQGAGHGAPVVAPAPIQETIQFNPGAGFGAGLYRLGVRLQAQRMQAGNLVQVQTRYPGKAALGQHARRVHTRLPALRPAKARAQAPHHTGLRPFLPAHAAGGAPGSNGLVARISPHRTGFFMAEQIGEAGFGPQGLQDLAGRPHANQQRQSARHQRRAQGCQTIERKLQVAGAEFRAVQPLRFDDEKAKCRLELLCRRQGRVVVLA